MCWPRMLRELWTEATAHWMAYILHGVSDDQKDTSNGVKTVTQENFSHHYGRGWRGKVDLRESDVSIASRRVMEQAIVISSLVFAPRPGLKRSASGAIFRFRKSFPLVRKSSLAQPAALGHSVSKQNISARR